MDFDRRPRRFSSGLRTFGLIVFVLAIVVAVSTSLSDLVPREPTMSRQGVLIDTVQQGELVHEVRGVGTLVSEKFLWIPATTEGRVVKILVRPGEQVTESTVLLELSNPKLELAVINATADVKSAQANLEATKSRLQKELFALRAKLLELKTEHDMAALTLEINEALFKQDVVTQNTIRMDKLKLLGFEKRIKIEEEGVKVFESLMPAEYAVPQAEISKAEAILKHNESEVAALNVLAGIDGVLEQMPVEIGQSVVPGDVLSKVSNPRPLKAELKIPEVQARYIKVGQRASIDTHHGIIDGTVVRIDPAVQGGNLVIDIEFSGELPDGARPDLSIIGTVEIRRLEDVVHSGRPVLAASDSTASIFKIDATGEFAIRVPVKYGVASVSKVEIIDGVKPGDQIILTDMSPWDGVDKIRLE